jgi:predicted esterase YcpF (UPF0227 family)
MTILFLHGCQSVPGSVKTNVRATGTADEELAKRVQLLEWQLLFDYCWKQAQ